MGKVVGGAEKVEQGGQLGAYCHVVAPGWKVAEKEPDSRLFSGHHHCQGCSGTHSVAPSQFTLLLVSDLSQTPVWSTLRGPQGLP